MQRVVGWRIIARDDARKRDIIHETALITTKLLSMNLRSLLK